MDTSVRRDYRWIVVLFIIVLMVGSVYVAWLALGAPAGGGTATSAMIDTPKPARPSSTPISTSTPRPTELPQTPESSPMPQAAKVGIVAGHWQSDSGAVCDDGLQEATINLDVGARVVAILQYEGYDAELLPEFTDGLSGYQAAAFVSIHTDACNVPGATGFKVARVLGSAIPEQEDRLVACLIQEYQEATGLSLHANSITYDMTDYHAFSEIDPQTPGAIIELGFMGADRDLLTEHGYEVAQGVARGIACFLDGE